MLDDDLCKVTEAITEADGLIVAAPTYFLGANALLKLLLDRGLSFYAHIDKLWGKPSIGVGIAGIKGKEGYTLLNIRSFLKMTMTDIKMTGMVYGALPGEIFFNEENKQTAAVLGSALFGDRVETKAPSCPLCRGDTFQFLGDNRVNCMLCSNAGTIEIPRQYPANIPLRPRLSLRNTPLTLQFMERYPAASSKYNHALYLQQLIC